MKFATTQMQASYQRYEIDPKEATHIAWWAKVLGVTEDALLAAVERVGNEVRAVEAYVSTHRARGRYH